MLTADDVVLNWTMLDASSPDRKGYYRVRDFRSREGVAFMNRNRTWTLIDGALKKPLVAWRTIR